VAVLQLLLAPGVSAALCSDYNTQECAGKFDGSCRCKVVDGACAKDEKDCDAGMVGTTGVVESGDYIPIDHGMVAVDEGYTIRSFKPQDCKPDDHTCMTITPDLKFCEEHCTNHGACHSFAYCTGAGNENAPFTRCYLKTKKVDFETIPHPGLGDCTTYGVDGTSIGDEFYVARNEGENLASFKPDCTEDETDFCHKVDEPTFGMCNSTCTGQSGCYSFAFCTGTELFPRCYLKTGDFRKKAHEPGDCSTYYPAQSATCKDMKDYYKTQECCGVPEKALDMNKGKPSGVQSF